MNLPDTINAALQVIAALLIFVASYLAFLVFIIICLVGAELISEHARVARDYDVRPVSLDTRALSEINGETRISSRRHPSIW